MSADQPVENYEIGYRKPPKEHRFSAEHQPTRRRRRSTRAELAENPLSYLADALTEPVQLRIKGKTRTAPFIEGFLRQVVHGMASDTPKNQMKVLEWLMKSGVLDVVALKQQLEVAIREVRKSDRWKKEVAAALESSRALLAVLQRLDFAQVVVTLARQRCKCGAFEGELADRCAVLDEWSREAAEEDQDSDPQEASLSEGGVDHPLAQRLPRTGAEDLHEDWPFDPDDRFYSGQLGND
jgi:hypothetical protein